MFEFTNYGQSHRPKPQRTALNTGSSSNTAKSTNVTFELQIPCVLTMDVEEQTWPVPLVETAFVAGAHNDAGHG